MSIIYKNGTYYGGGGAGAEITIDNELSSTSENPIQNKVIKTELDNKVDKVTGKGLSTNDYTDEEKEKLAGITAGAEPNVQSDWNQTDTSADDFIKNKPISVTESLEGEEKGLDLSLVTTGEKYYWSTGVSDLFTRTIDLSHRIETTPHPFYATCETEASESQKSIDLDLETYSSEIITSGMIIGVKFTNTNTANNIMFGGMGKAYTSIKYNGAIYTGNDPKITGWENHVIYYMYDGEYFVYMGNDTNESNIDDMPAGDMAEVASPMPSIMSRRFKYSTDEQIVGEWIDGKPVYQKTINVGNISKTATINHNISNLDVIVDATAFGKERGITWFIIPRTDDSMISYQRYLAVNATQVFLNGGSSSVDMTDVHVTLKYTKTTD